MRKSVRRVLYRLTPQRLLAPALLFLEGPDSQLLNDRGYARSLRLMLPVDERDQPLPFIPYAMVSLLEERLQADFDVLEFGSGYSTMFFMSRVRRVVSVEHDAGWLGILRAQVSSTVTLLPAPRDPAEAYAAASPAQERFDLVLVDGRHRVECMRRALSQLTARGVILLDDSDREIYQEAFRLARADGFRTLTLKGHKPGAMGLHQSTLFYRDGNCLGI